MDYSDTIVAVSSPTGGLRSIVRITGPETLSVCKRIFAAPIDIEANGILSGSVAIDNDLTVDARLYLFFCPHSYTGEDLAELHLFASPVLVATLVQNLLAMGLRSAGPGEFTARAYLNGKLDLAQAEAVNEVIASSNRFQLDAAERLLSGRLTQTTKAARSALLECLSLIEAGLDFSTEDIAFISPEEATDRLTDIRADLEGLLAGSIRYETLIDLPSVGIAGAPNAGKSSLLNALLGHERSLVSDRRKTTRDVLSGLWTTDRFQCVLFDCAGLLPAPQGLLDKLAQRAAIEALKHCQVVLFCVDATKQDCSEDISVRELIEPKELICVATKADLLNPTELTQAGHRLAQAFGGAFVPVSARTEQELAQLQDLIETSLMAEQGPAGGDGHDATALTARHKQAVGQAISSLDQAIAEIERGADEVAATMIRSAHQVLSDIEQQPIDEQILDHIFSRFCIGK